MSRITRTLLKRRTGHDGKTANNGENPQRHVELDYLEQQIALRGYQAIIHCHLQLRNMDCAVSGGNQRSICRHRGCLTPLHSGTWFPYRFLRYTDADIVKIISSRIVLEFSEAESQGEIVSSQLDRYTVYYVYIMVAALVTLFVSTAGFNYTGARITRTIRLRYFDAMLKQNMAVFDDKCTGNILSQLTDDTKAIQEALSSKLSQTISALGTLVATVAVCFAMDWILMFKLIWSLAVGYAVLYVEDKLTVCYSSHSIEASSTGSVIVEKAPLLNLGLIHS